MLQTRLFDSPIRAEVKPLRHSLLKWIGNKQRVAHKIISFFPNEIGTYYEPFLGSGAVMGTLAPERAVGSDSFGPLMEIWLALKEDPQELKEWYATRWHAMAGGEKVVEYERIKASYNHNPNGADFVFLCRSCYGGVVRFRKHDGYMSTPCGIHSPISPESFNRRVDIWRLRTVGTHFVRAEYANVLELAQAGDLVYCDPPYSHSQSILYGAQDFSLANLFDNIQQCKDRGVFVAVSIDGNKRSGNLVCDIPIPKGLFEREAFITVGRSMLRRFQMEGKSLETEIVADRLLLTY